MVSKQSNQDRYVTAITVVSCSYCHASLGNLGGGVELTIFRAANRDANHYNCRLCNDLPYRLRGDWIQPSWRFDSAKGSFVPLPGLLYFCAIKYDRLTQRP